MTRSTRERPVGAHSLAQALCQLARRRGITLPGRPTEEAVRERILYEAVEVPAEAAVSESWTVRVVGGGEECVKLRCSTTAGLS